jgi:hypothetical protein
MPPSSHRTPDCFFQVLVPAYARIVVLGAPVLLWSIVCELRQRVTNRFCVVGGAYVVLGVALQASSLHCFAKFYGRLALAQSLPHAPHSAHVARGEATLARAAQDCGAQAAVKGSGIARVCRDKQQ